MAITHSTVATFADQPGVEINKNEWNADHVVTGGQQNGVAYRDTSDLLAITSQGPANSVLTANAGAPSFSATPTVNSLTIAGSSGNTLVVNTSTLVVDATNGRVGIGLAAPGQRLALDFDSTTTSAEAMSNFVFDINNSSDITAPSTQKAAIQATLRTVSGNSTVISGVTARTMTFFFQHFSGQSLTTVQPLNGELRLESGASGTITTARCIQGTVNTLSGNNTILSTAEAFNGGCNLTNSGAVTHTNIRGGNFTSLVGLASGATVTNAEGVIIGRPGATAGSTITNSRGLVIQNQTSASGTHTNTPYGIVQEGTGDRNVLLANTVIGGSSTTATPTNKLQVLLDDATTNAVTYPLRVSHTTTGTPANGIGAGIQFECETTANNNETGATIEAVCTDVTAGSEDFDLKFMTMAAGAAATLGLVLTSDKRLYGTTLHNNAGAVTGTTNQYIASGTYTPTLNNVANLDASTAYKCQWVRVGNVVVVSGKVDVDPTLAATSTQLGISLPIASNLANAQDCSGTAFASGIATQGAAILADATNDRAQMQWISGDVTNQAMYFSFQYEVL